MAVDAVQNPFVGSQVGRDEREQRGGGARVEVRVDLHAVLPQRKRRHEADLLLEVCVFGQHHARIQNALDLVFRFIQLFHAVFNERDVCPQTEQFLRRLLKRIAQGLQVAQCRFEDGVADQPFFFAFGKLGLHRRHFFIQLFHDRRGVDGMEMDGDVEKPVQVDHRREPVGVKVARVGIQKQRAQEFVAKLKVAAVDKHR